MYRDVEERENKRLGWECRLLQVLHLAAPREMMEYFEGVTHGVLSWGKALTVQAKVQSEQTSFLHESL